MMIEARTLALAGIRHGFFTRQGGVSGGLYASLNGGVGSNDDRAHVAENRARMAAAVGVEPSRFLTAYQIHSPQVVVAETPWLPEARPRADAIVTRMRALAIGVTHRRLRADPASPTRKPASSAPPMPAGAARSPASSRPRSTPWSGSAPSAATSAPCSDR